MLELTKSDDKTFLNPVNDLTFAVWKAGCSTVTYKGQRIIPQRAEQANDTAVWKQFRNQIWVGIESKEDSSMKSGRSSHFVWLNEVRILPRTDRETTS